MREIRLTIAQIQSIAGDTEGNFRRMEGIVRDNTDSDIICFHEMCLSGYSTNDPRRFALSPDNEYILKVRDLAKETGSCIVFGYLEENGEKPYMSQEIADGTDDPKLYRKTHLGTAESKVFAVGDDLPVFDVKGVCVGIQLCIESHIQDICSTFRAKGAELVLTPFANGITGERRRAVWYSYLPARASDNGLYVAACSAIGNNGQGAEFGGGLILIDPKGQVIDEYYGTDEHCLTAVIDGKLPRDGPETMSNISYYDRRRPELYR
ncbi:MAG: hypothetical protein IKP04_05750 [Candidatus Methanomethylophilaceae archaeon]|nr:hypothetical protein [Candidatus Methanomethylophilaceae archaeon]